MQVLLTFGAMVRFIHKDDPFPYFALFENDGGKTGAGTVSCPERPVGVYARSSQASSLKMTGRTPSLQHAICTRSWPNTFPPPASVVACKHMLAENIKRRSKVRTKHPFAGKIVCGDCGGFYGHKVWRLRSTGERYDVWYCNHKYDGDEICDSPRLQETEIRDAFEKALQECGDPNPVYTDERWNELVQSVAVYRGNNLIFNLANGETVKITL